MTCTSNERTGNGGKITWNAQEASGNALDITITRAGQKGNRRQLIRSAAETNMHTSLRELQHEQFTLHRT